MKVLMVGASGNYARSVLPALKRHGAQVRALVRSPELGVAMVHAAVAAGVKKFTFSSVIHPSISK